jgi:CheY-like chemotaxis protein
MTHQIRVLYVDDEPDLRQIACLSLQLDPGIEVRACASGEEALPIAAEWQPSLILLDMMMPGLDGLATRRLLREGPATAGIPVAFVTAAARRQEREQLEKADVIAIIAKPFDCLRLAQTVRGLLADNAG